MQAAQSSYLLELFSAARVAVTSKGTVAIFTRKRLIQSRWGRKECDSTLQDDDRR